MFGGISAQALGLVLVLAPGLIFLFGYHSAPLRWPCRRPIQTGLLFDAALFAFTSLVIHLASALLALWADSLLSCSTVIPIERALSLAVAAPADPCGVGFLLLAVLAYTLTAAALSFALGRFVAWQIAARPRLFRVVYGSLFEVSSSGVAFILANVLTDIAHDGGYLIYEGELVEVSLGTGNTVNYVCLASAKRFLLRFEDGATRTTPRDSFIKIDREGALPSRLTIPGEHALNILTRTYPLEREKPRWGWLGPAVRVFALPARARESAKSKPRPGPP